VSGPSSPTVHAGDCRVEAGAARDSPQLVRALDMGYRIVRSLDAIHSLVEQTD